MNWNDKVETALTTHIHFIHFPESAEFYDNFDSNIGAQRSVNMENLPLKSTIYENDVENAPS